MYLNDKWARKCFEMCPENSLVQQPCNIILKYLLYRSPNFIDKNIQSFNCSFTKLDVKIFCLSVAVSPSIHFDSWPPFSWYFHILPNKWRFNYEKTITEWEFGWLLCQWKDEQQRVLFEWAVFLWWSVKIALFCNGVWLNVIARGANREEYFNI